MKAWFGFLQDGCSKSVRMRQKVETNLSGKTLRGSITLPLRNSNRLKEIAGGVHLLERKKVTTKREGILETPITEFLNI